MNIFSIYVIVPKLTSQVLVLDSKILLYVSISYICSMGKVPCTLFCLQYILHVFPIKLMGYYVDHSLAKE
jgi:hypothetical protein